MEYINPKSKDPQTIGVLTLQGVTFTGKNPAKVIEIVKDSEKEEWVKIHITIDESVGLTIFDQRKATMGLCKQHLADRSNERVIELMGKNFNSSATVVYMPNDNNYRLALSDPNGDQAETYLLIAMVETVEGKEIVGNEITHMKTQPLRGKSTSLYLAAPRPGDRSGIPTFGYFNLRENKGGVWVFLYGGAMWCPWSDDADLQKMLEAKPAPPPTPVTIATPIFQFPEFTEEELGKFSMDLLCKKIGPMYGLSVEELEKIEKKADLVAEISLAIEGFFLPVEIEEEPESAPTAPTTAPPPEKEPTRMAAAIEAALNGENNNKVSPSSKIYTEEELKGMSKGQIKTTAQSLGYEVSGNKPKRIREFLVAQNKINGKEEEKKEDVKK